MRVGMVLWDNIEIRTKRNHGSLFLNVGYNYNRCGSAHTYENNRSSVCLNVSKYNEQIPQKWHYNFWRRLSRFDESSHIQISLYLNTLNYATLFAARNVEKPYRNTPTKHGLTDGEPP